jgi:hypothetical protein
MICPRCGIKLKRGHINSRWHKVAPEIRKLGKMGVRYSRIAKDYGFSREYIRRRLAEWGK